MVHKYKKPILLLGVSSLILMSLSGCSGKEEPKEAKEATEISSLVNTKAKTAFYYADYLEINNQRFGDITEYMNLANIELKDVTNTDSKLINTFNHILNSTYSNDVKKDDLYSYLFEIKTRIEANDGKYTKELKESYEYKYMNITALNSLFSLLFPIKTSDLHQLEGDFTTYTLVSYETNSKNKSKDLKKVKKDLKDINTYVSGETENQVLNADENYRMYNLDILNPIASKELTEELKTKKVSDVFIFEDGDSVEVYKVLNKSVLSIEGKKSVMELLAYTEYLNQQGSVKNAIIDLIKTLDSQSNNVSISKEAYADLSRELDNLTEEDKTYFLRLGLQRYLETNYSIF